VARGSLPLPSRLPTPVTRRTRPIAINLLDFLGSNECRPRYGLE